MISQCAYDRTDNDFTCLTKNELSKIVETFVGKVDTGATKQDLYNKIQTIPELQNKTDMELIREYNKKEGVVALVPVDILKPPKPEKYLSNLDIDMVFDQFSKKHPEFMSFGAVPYDFWNKPNGSWKKNCEKIFGFDLEKFIKGGKTKWGMVSNTEKSGSNGSHWVCLYFEINKDKKTAIIEYFDSIGTEQCRSMVSCSSSNIPVKINNFITHVQQNCAKYKYTCQMTTSKKQHQYGDNECGMYCIYYIMSRIQGKTLADMGTIPDGKMSYLRNFLFLGPHYCWKCKKYKKSIKPLLERWGNMKD